MARVRVTGWQEGMDKVAMTKVYQRDAGVGLKSANEMTDTVLAGNPVEFEVETMDRAWSVASSLRDLGAVVDVVEGPSPSRPNTTN